MFALVLFLLFATVYVLAAANSRIQRTAGGTSRRRGRTISSDGHAVPKDQDLTCEDEYGHHHPSLPDAQPRYIVHEEPTEGYVILNGVKRKISDCRNL